MILIFGKQNFGERSNKVKRLQYGIHWVPLVTTINYFKNYENIYFLVLAAFQLLTLSLLPKEWSPTGPFSTAIPLAICVLIEIATAMASWYTVWKQDRRENNMVFQSVLIDPVSKSRTLYPVKNQDMFPGYIIYLSKNEICPADAILIEAVMDDYAKINLALLTGESNIKHISKPNSDLLLSDYTGSKLIINRNRKDAPIDGSIILDERNDVVIELSERNFIPAGSIIKSEGVYIWITRCGRDKASTVDKISSKKYSRIDKFVGEYMLKVSVFLLVALVTIISVIKTLATTKQSIFTFVVLCIQNWILFNSVIPFSVKIFMILARNLEAQYGSSPLMTKFIRVSEPLRIDDIGGVQKVVCDKTGTITKNELEFNKLVATGSNCIIDVGSYSTETQSIPRELYECLGLCIHQTDSDFATVEDRIIRAGYQSLGAQCDESKSKCILTFLDEKSAYDYYNVNGLDFTFDRKISSRIVKNSYGGYSLYTKGSLDALGMRVKYKYQSELHRMEQLISIRYPDLRLLAFGYKKLDNEEISMLSDSTSIHHLEHNLTLAGIIGIKDIIQDNVPLTISNLKSYGINCSICTGDRKVTAIAVAEEVTIINGRDDLIEYNPVLIANTLRNKTLIFGGESLRSPDLTKSGSEIPNLESQQHFQQCLANCRNFVGFHMAPGDKKRVVELLEADGTRTLAIGDGFNDLGMFCSASVSVAISGNNSVENSADFTTKQFSGLNDIFKLGITSYFKNAHLANFTFYRCAVVAFAIAAHCLINYDKQYEPPFSGFVLQAFNFAWLICAIAYLIIREGDVSDMVVGFKASKNMAYTSYRYTTMQNVYGILDGIFIVGILHFYDIDKRDYFNDTLGLLVITLLNYKLLRINMKQSQIFDSIALLCCLAGIIIFIIYSIYMGTILGVLSLITSLPISLIGVCALWFK
jgi:phospholipid-translocating ATPase